MITKIIELCFYRRHIIWGLAILIAIYGYIACKNMTIEAYPELSDTTVYVITQVPGLASEEIEKQITLPLERALINVPGLLTIRSSSTFALSLITLIFKEGTENYWARERTMDHMIQATLPPGIQPMLGPLTGSAGEIYRYTLESNTKNLLQLSDLQRWTVIPTLKEVEGVTDVDNFGGLTKEFQLNVDAALLQSYNLGLNDVITAISNNTSNAGGGRLTRGEQNYIVRGIGQIHTLDDLNAVVVAQNDGLPILVKDLGTVTFGHKEREGLLGKNYNPDTIQGSVQMRKDENPSKVLDDLHAKLKALQKKLNMIGVKIVPYLDRDQLVHKTIDKVTHTVIEGILLVFITLLLFLRSPRSALVVSVAIPAALISIFIFINATGMSANLFSLGAIDFGVIVDGAIVVMEAILRHREEHNKRYLTTEETLKITNNVARPIFFATLIIISAYLPLFAFERAEGKLFKPMGFTVSYALLGALACAMMLIPGLAYTAFRKPQKIKQNHVLLWLTKQYRFWLSRLLIRPAITFIIGLSVLLTIFVLSISAGREFLPELDEGTLWLQVEMPPGISLEKANDMASDLRKRLLAHPEISYTVSQLGRSDEATDPWPLSHVEIAVGLKPYSKWPSHETKSQFISKLSKEFAELPGYTIGISQPIIDNVNDVLAGAHSPLVLRIYGNDLIQARQIGQQIEHILKTIRGTSSVSIFQPPPVPQLVLEIDREKTARFGINISDITTLIQTGLVGAPVAMIYDNDQIHNATIRFPSKDKKSIESLGNLFIKSPSGTVVLLSQLAKIKYQNGESTISHEKNRRQITLRIDNRGRALSSYLAEAERRIQTEVKFDPDQFHLEWAGQFESQQRAQKRLSYMLIIMLIVMSFLLFLEFQQLRLVVLILAVVPMATLGGLMTLHLTGETLNVATSVGFIALFGVAVQNAIIMIANIRRVRELKTPLGKSVINGAAERLRPVLMTATVASFGMLPAALTTGVGTDVQRELATIIVGGLWIATLLTLFILPTYYYVLERFIEKGGFKAFTWRKS